MKVRRYFAASMRSALEMVREEQGPDVLILSNRKLDDGVELITADGEIDEQLLQSFTKAELDAKLERRPSESPKQSVREIPKRSAGTNEPQAPGIVSARTAGSIDTSVDNVLWTDEATVQKMQVEMENIKGLLEQQLSGLAWSDYGNKHPVRARVMRAMSRLGLEPRIARSIVEQVPDEMSYKNAWFRALAVLRSRLQIVDDPILKRGGCVALCGATGVGKTTLATKLAARFGMMHGTDSVAVVSIDDHRLGAPQQLRVFGRLSGIDVSTVETGESLSHHLSKVGHKRLIVIDTSGFAPDDIRFREQLTKLVDVQTYLAIAATTDYSTLSKTMTSCGEMDIRGCLLTKVDEAALLGAPLSVLIESQSPLAYVSAGQAIPDDLEAVNGKALIERAVTMAGETLPSVDSSRLERAFA